MKLAVRTLLTKPPALSFRKLLICSMIAILATTAWMLIILISPFYVKFPTVTLPYVRLPMISIPSIHLKFPTARFSGFRISAVSQFRYQSPFSDGRGILSALVLGIVSNVRDALSIVKEEQKRTTAERDAFDTFARAVETAEPTIESTTNTSIGTTLVVEANTRTSELQTIERAYRETVMSVSHYEEEYGESLATNMAIEFGDELAMAVLEGDQLTPPLQQSLYKKAIEAREQRTRFLSLLEDERSVLQQAKRTVREVENARMDTDEPALISRSFDELASLHERLEHGQEVCDRLLADRQQQRKDGHAGRVRAQGLVDLQSYLYDPLEVQYPILSDVIALLDRLQESQRRVRTALTRRV